MNYFSDSPDRMNCFDQLDLSAVVRLKERQFEEAEHHPGAPRDVGEARELYRDILLLVGDMAASQIAPLARSIDDEGVSLRDGRISLGSGMQNALKVLQDSGISSLTLSRAYGGANLPGVINLFVIEMLSQADASLMTLFALQEISWTIEKFGTQAQKRELLPQFASGTLTGAMTFTEAEAGSDLAAVVSRAIDEGDGWRLTGTKRFITNGDADVHLVLARSAEKEAGMRGLSLFLYRKDSTLEVRRVESKLGLHGSPTAEIHYNNSPCELVGDPRLGLAKYAMSLMSNARLAVSAQALGIAQAAQDAAWAYAQERRQFGKKLAELPAVRGLLEQNALELEIIRSFLYDTARLNDELELLELGEEAGDRSSRPEAKERIRFLRKRVGVFVPLLKYYAAEAGQRICSEALQIHGGAGYTKDFDVERHYRDIRIASIYEGTSQIQVNAAFGGLFRDVFEEDWAEIDRRTSEARRWEEERKVLDEAVRLWALMKAVVHERGTPGQEDSARILADTALTIHFGFRLLDEALRSPEKQARLSEFLRFRISSVVSWHKQILNLGRGTGYESLFAV